MNCLRCRHKNPPQSRFCFECGARLATSCGGCGAELPAGVKFCNQSEKSEAHYQKALALAAPRGMRPLVAHCHLGLGKLYARTGKRRQAEEHLAGATAMYRAMDMGFWLTQAEAETGSGG